METEPKTFSPPMVTIELGEYNQLIGRVDELAKNQFIELAKQLLIAVQKATGAPASDIISLFNAVDGIPFRLIIKDKQLVPVDKFKLDEIETNGIVQKERARAD